MNRYRTFAIIGSILGCTFCSATLYIPFNELWYPFQLDAFTIPVLTSAFIETLLAVTLILFLKDLPIDPSAIQGTFGSDEAKGILFRSLALNAGNFLFFLGVWLFFSVLVVLGALYWHVIHSFSTIWHAYIPVLAGAFASFLGVRILTKRMGVRNWHMMVGGPPLAAVGTVFLFEWSSPPSQTLFFIGGSLVFLCQGVYQTGEEGRMRKGLDILDG